MGKENIIRFDARNLQFRALYFDPAVVNYEPEVGMLLDDFLPEDGVFFDIGSNWGYFSLFATSNRHHLNIHAFEPMPDTFLDLKSCIEQANVSEFVTCHQLALSSSDGEAFIEIPDRLHSGQATVSFGRGTHCITTRRLDTMNLPKPDLIKMDVEEHEMDVLRGAEKTLRSARPFIVFENKPNESEPERALEPLFFLRELGYHLFAPDLGRTFDGRRYYTPAGSQSSRHDLLVLTKLEPEMRLLRQRDLNVFACPEERISQLQARYNVRI
jgi:FkbM family methyltransferase